MVYNNSLFQSNFKKNPIYSEPQKPLETPSPPKKLTMQEEKTKGLRPLLAQFGLFLASYASSPIPSLYQRVEFKKTHRKYNMNMAWHKAKYGEDLVGLTRNLSKEEHHVRKKEKEAAKGLMKTCKDLLKLDEFSHLTLNKNEKFKPLEDDGICSGVRTYVASAVLHGTPIEDVIDELDKGAPVKAAANQYAYQAIKSKPLATSQLIVQIIDSLTEVASSPNNEKLNVNPRAVQVALFLSDTDFLTPSFKNSTQAVVNSLNNQEAIFTGFVRSSVPKESVIKDLEKFQKTVQEKIDHHFAEQIDEDPSSENFTKQLQIRESYTESLKLTVSLLEMKNAINYQKKAGRTSIFKKKAAMTRDAALQKITNPLHRELILNIDDENSNLMRHQVVAAANDIKYSSLQSIMGNSVLMKDDHAYLSNLDKLDSGVYGITIRISAGSHALFYKKNDDGTGNIIDPNGPQLFCKDVDHAKVLLETVIGTYTDPKVKSILAGPKDRHHQISFIHIQKRDAITDDN